MKKVEYNRFKYFYDFLLKLDIPLIKPYVLKKVYDTDFYEDANKLKILSSKQVASIINSYYDFKTILDIGCGMGLYIQELQKLGKDVIGCDNSVYGIKKAPQEIIVFYADVTKPIFLNKKFDIVLCFEVAEHIKKKDSKQLIDNCTNHSDTILFTAAPKGQGGVGHINEQSFEYWKNLFHLKNFQYYYDLSEKIKQEMKSNNVVEWIANNFMSFHKTYPNV